jgi:hypothetical protein
MGCHPPYPTAASDKTIVSDANVKKVAIFDAMSPRAIKSLARARPDILPLEKSDVTNVSSALTAALSLMVEESDSDKLSDAAFA